MSTNKQDDSEVFSPTGKKVVIAGQTFSIKPFVLGNRIKVVRLFSQVFMECAKMPGFSQLADTGAIMTIIDVAGDRLVDIYEVVLGKDKEWMNANIQIKDEITIISAIMEVNDLPFLVSQIQKMIAQSNKK